MALIQLCLIILIAFMICIMKDAYWHLAQNLGFYAMTENNQWPKNYTRTEATDTAFDKEQGTNKSYQEYSQKAIYREQQGGSQFLLRRDGKFRPQGDH